MQRGNLVLGRCAGGTRAWLAALALLACDIQVQAEPDDAAWDDGSGFLDSEPPGLPPLPELDDPRTPREGPGLTRYRELLVLDPSLVAGELAANGNPTALWSFRRQMSWLAGSEEGALAFSARFLTQWERVSAVGQDQAPVTPRPAVRELLLVPWLAERVPEAPAPRALQAGLDRADAGAASSVGAVGNSGDAGMAAPDEPLDLYGDGAAPLWAQAPFRLIAIVNRIDLAEDACAGAGGELRYVYTATRAGTEQPLDMTLIVEIPYPRTRSAASWARAWQELARLPDLESYRSALGELTEQVLQEADPLRARVRSNENALEATSSWEMREFQLQLSARGQLALLQVPLEFTPRADVDLGVLAQHLLDRSLAVMDGEAVLPGALRAGAAEISEPAFSWTLPGVNGRLRQAFSQQTCNGCHAGDTDTARFQHIAPVASASAPAKLSRFLHDEAAPSDELRRRTVRLQTLAASRCLEDETPDSFAAPYGAE